MNNNLPNAPEDKKISFLLGVRDNLLKPMTEEICAKTEKKINSLQKLLWWMIGIAAFSALIQIVSIIMFLKFH